MGLFGESKGKNPKEQVNEWNHKLRKEGFQLDRQIRSIQREEEKVKRQLKEAGKKGDKDVCKVYAKEIIRSRKAVTRIYVAKAQINSVQLSMKQQLATLRVSGALAKSTEVMQSMQKLIKLPEIQATMRDMSKEMMKAGIIEEMMDDTFSQMEDDDLEEAADEEVNKVLYELTAGKLGEAPEVIQDSLPVAEQEEAGAVGGEEDMDDMQARLQALRS